VATKTAKPVKTDTVSLAEAAYMLQSELGTLRQWVAFLNDTNKGDPTSVCGITLPACAQQHDGHQWRPRYALFDVREFIGRVQAIEPTARPKKIEPEPLMIHKGRYWKLNKFDKEGNPVTATMRHLAPMSRAIGYTGTAAATMH
jgi:hypothetical protein